MKKIAVTQRIIENDSYPEIREALDVRWGGFMTECGLLPITLSTSYCFKTVYQECGFDGILLTGGNDLSSQSNNPLSRERDCFEKALLTFALEKSLPIIGVCRGMQLIAEIFNASLKKIPNHIATNHNLLVNTESMLANLLSPLKCVNSFHQFSIAKEPKGFLVSARSDDGAIEAMEATELKIFCQMWHPERNTLLSEVDINLFKHIFKA